MYGGPLCRACRGQACRLLLFWIKLGVYVTDKRGHWRKYHNFLRDTAWTSGKTNFFLPSPPSPTIAYHPRCALTWGVPSPSQGRAQHHQDQCQSWHPGASKETQTHHAGEQRGQGTGEQASLTQWRLGPSFGHFSNNTNEGIHFFVPGLGNLGVENQSASEMYCIISRWSKIHYEEPLLKLGFPSLKGLF